MPTKRGAVKPSDTDSGAGRGGTAVANAAGTETTPSEWAAGLDLGVREVVERLRRIVRDAVPRAAEHVEGGRLCYTISGCPLCWIGVHSGGAALGFAVAGFALTDPDRLLQGVGEAERWLVVRSVAQIRAGLLSMWLKRAAEFVEDC